LKFSLLKFETKSVEILRLNELKIEICIVEI